jgi:sigma-E factor negative regulatory protein RseA
MNTNKMTQEQISALADGELEGAHIDTALTAVRQPDGHAAWDIYHQIGDVMRSDEMAVALSPGFAARMAARLEAEPAIIVPANRVPSCVPEHQAFDVAASARRAIRRFALPGMVAAAAATVALMAGPQLMVATNGSSPDANEPAVVSASSGMSHASAISAAAPRAAAASSTNARDGTVLRDPRIDEYLLAHQRFSPSVYSTAQFARSATFATDSDK